MPGYGALTPDGGGVWVTETLFPFAARRFNSEWSEGLVLEPPHAALDSMAADAGQVDLASWASLPVVPLGDGYLQTLADLATDRRLIVHYDSNGTVVSSIPVDVPIGLLLHADDPSRVLGARRTDVLEVVEYTYHWGN